MKKMFSFSCLLFCLPWLVGLGLRGNTGIGFLFAPIISSSWKYDKQHCLAFKSISNKNILLKTSPRRGELRLC